jgi:hypothetical protein
VATVPIGFDVCSKKGYYWDITYHSETLYYAVPMVCSLG